MVITLVHYVLVIRGLKRVHPASVESNQRRERKVARTIGIVIAVFSICFSFYVYVRIAEKYFPSNVVDDLLWSKLKLASLIFMTQQVLNPLVYGLLNSQIRVDLISLFQQFSCSKVRKRIPATGSSWDDSAGHGVGNSNGTVDTTLTGDLQDHGTVENGYHKRTVYLITFSLDIFRCIS